MSGVPRKRLPIRWLTLAEIVGLTALVIAGLGYWDTHKEHVLSDRERAQAEREQARSEALKQSFIMAGSVQDGGDVVRLSPVRPEQVIQTQTVWFPAAIRSDSIETTGNPRLEAGWIAGGLRKAAGKARAGRVPVGVLTVFIEDGQTRTDRSLYELGYSLQPRLLRPDRVRLEGLSLARRAVAGDLQDAAGTLWAAR